MHYVFIGIVALLLLACDSNSTNPYHQTSVVNSLAMTSRDMPLTEAKDSLPSQVVTREKRYINDAPATYVDVPTFTIQLRPSAKVKALLNSKQETLIVSLALFGSRAEQTAGEEDEEDLIYLLDREYSFSGALEDIVVQEQISEEALKALENGDYEVAVNAYSGRKSSPNNIFHTDALSGHIMDFKGKTKVLSIRLLD